MRFLVSVGKNIGDCAVNIPTCKAIVRNGHSLEIITGTNLFEDCDFISKVHIKDSRSIIADLALYPRLIQEKWDAVLYLRKGSTTFRPLHLFGTAKFKKHMAHMDESLRASGIILFHLSILDGLIDDWRDPIETEIPFNPTRYDRAAKIADIDLDEPYLTVAPGSSSPDKCWPLENFAEVIKKIGANYAHILIVGAPNEKGLCEKLTSLCGGGGKSLAGKTTLLETCALVSSAQQHIGNDSGLGHVAAGNGTATLSIGATEFWRPWKQNAIDKPLDQITPDEVIRSVEL